MKKETRNSKVLRSFVKYCEKNPSERFWQALRDWDESPFILRASGLDSETGKFSGEEDTFYEE